MPLYDYYIPNSTLNANLTTANRFFTKDDWRCGRFENFESDHHYESNPESEVRFEIESNLETSQVPSSHCRRDEIGRDKTKEQQFMCE